MIADRDEEKQPGQKGDDDNADRGPREEFEVKMFRAVQPRGSAAEDASTNRCGLGRVDLSH